MKTINVVSLVAVGSITALLLCWSRHDPPKSEASQAPLSTVSFVDGIAGDTASMSHGTCCLAVTSSQAESCSGNRKNDPVESVQLTR